MLLPRLTGSGIAEGPLMSDRIAPPHASARGARYRFAALLGLLVLALGGLRAAHAVGTILQPGDLVLVDNRAFSSGGVIQVNPTSGAQTDVTHDGFLRNPGGLALEPSGHILVADSGASGVPPRIIRVTPASGAQEVVTSGGLLNVPIGIVVAPNGRFYIADAGIPGVVEFNPLTSQQTLISSAGSLVTPEHLTIGPDGFLYVADATLPGVVKVNPVNGSQSVVPHNAALGGVYGLAFDTAGKLFVAEASSGQVFRIDPNTGVQTLVTGTGYLNIPLAMAWRAEGKLVICDRAGGVGGVWSLDPNGNGQPQLISSGGYFGRPQDIAVVPHPVPTQGDLLVVDSDYSSSGGVIRVDRDTHQQNLVSAGGFFQDPVAITVAANGDLLVIDANAIGGPGAVIRVNPQTGAQQVVSSGQYFVNPFGLVETENGDILVVDTQAVPLPDDPNHHQGAVIRVNPATGTQSLVSGGGVGQGVSFLLPNGIALEADGQIMVVDVSGRVLRVNPVTGNRSLRAFGDPFQSPVGIAVEASGNYVVADADAFPYNSGEAGPGGVIRVRPDGVTTSLSQRGLFQSPQGLTVDLNEDLLVVDADAEAGTGAVVLVDPVSGAQTLLSSHGYFSDPRGIAVIPGTAPEAVADDASTFRNAAVLIPALGNDMDAAGGSAVKTTDPQHGTATLTSDGQGFTYQPVAGYVGADSFTYRARANGVLSNTAAVHITVINRAPNVVSNSFSGWRNCPLDVPAPGVLANDSDADGDSLTASVAALPTGGSLDLDADGGFMYTPNPGVTSDSFTYRTHDGHEFSEPATVTITLAADAVKPTCVIGAVVTENPSRIYVPVTLGDAHSGVARVQLTSNSSNCMLEGPNGSTAAVGGSIVLHPALGSLLVKAVKLNPTQKARVELRVTDCSGNWLLCDPVIAELVIPKGARSVVETFSDLPQAEHYFTAENRRPGVDRVQVRVNRAAPKTFNLKPGSTKTFNFSRAMQVGSANRYTVKASGRPGTSVLIVIGDTAPGGASVRSLAHVPGLNFEFGR